MKVTEKIEFIVSYIGDYMLISEIEPIKNRGINLTDKEDSLDIIDKIVELPLRKACKIFVQKGITTIMSSANKNNIILENGKILEKEDLKGRELFLDRPTFEDAGKGYAWIMIDYDSLSDENKDWLFDLESRQDSFGNKVGEKAIWFVQPTLLGNIIHDLTVGKISQEFLQEVFPEECEIYKDIKVDQRLVEFEKRRIILSHGYQENSVFLRMPVNSDTTVEEVEEFFSQFAQAFKNQQIKKAKEAKEDRINDER